MIYSEKYRIEYSDCDENQHLRLPVMIDLLMHVSEHQLKKGTAGTNNMLKHGWGWVVTQYHIEVSNLPKPEEQVILSTQPAGYNRFFEYRDFKISTLDNQTLIKVTSQWVMFDLKKRKLIPCDQKLMQELNVPLLNKMPRFPRIRLQTNYERKRQYRVRYDDLDINHHLTNGHYFNWFIDMLDRDFLKENIVHIIDIKFDKEVRYGQQPYSCIKINSDGNKTKTWHAIIDSDGSQRAVCEIVWQKI